MLLPIIMTSPLYYDAPMSLDQAIEQVNPAIILVDRFIDDLMTRAAHPADPNHRLYVGFEAFQSRRHATLTCVMNDRTYGTMRVYRLPSEAARVN